MELKRRSRNINLKFSAPSWTTLKNIWLHVYHVFLIYFLVVQDLLPQQNSTELLSPKY